MGRHLERTNSGVQFEGSHPGCMWGILHILDYHHWHNAKKMRPRKKHRGLGRHASCKTNEQATLKKRDIGVQEFMDSEGEPLLVEQHDTESSPAKTNRRSGKAHIKESIAKDMPKQSHRYWNLSYAARTWFWRIIPIHHLEHADNYLGEMHTVGANPIIPLEKSANTSASTGLQTSLSVTPEEQDIGHKKFGVWDTMNDVNYMRHNQSVGKHAVFPKKCDEGSDDFVHHNLGESNQLNIEVPNNQFKECSDVLEIFKIHKESFLKILQDTNVGMKHFQSLQNSKHKARLTKSGSFPLANSSSKKYISTRTLEHKQNESWSFPKGEKMLSSSLVSESDSSVSQRSMPSMADNNTVGSAMRQETNYSSPDSSQGLIHRGWNQQVINHFKEIKQKIWHALKENRKESNPTSMEPLIEREPSGKEISGTSKISMSQGGIDNPGSLHEGNGSDYDPSRGRLGYIQRTSSLNESLDRYTELFERTFGQGAKWHHSKSLKLTDEGKVPSSGFASKSVKRRLSLPDLYFCSSLNDPSRDSLSSVMPIRTAGDCCTIVEKNNHCEPKSFSTLVEEQTPEPIHAALETEFQKDMITGNDSSWNVLSSADLTVERNHEGNAKTGNLSDLTVGKGSLQPDQIFGLTMNHSRELVGFSTEIAEPDPVSDLQTRFPDDLNNLAEFPIYEGPASSPMDIQMDDPDASVDEQIMSNTYSLPVVCSIVTPETTEETNMNTEDQTLHFKLDESDEADFNYVRLVLELSGFIKNENLGTWHSLDQPLSPLLFKELEAFLHPELEDYEEDVDGSCDHQILFYLINDTLVEIYERSFTYFPRAFTFNRHIRPMPRGHHLLEEVWAKISLYLSLRPELDQSLEDVLARDLAKGDGWMNLQFDNECVALELEDLILEELLNELVCS